MRCSRCFNKIYYMYVSIFYKSGCVHCINKIDYTRCSRCSHFYKDYSTCPLCDIEIYALIQKRIDTKLNQIEIMKNYKIKNDDDKQMIFDKFNNLISELDRLTVLQFNSDIIIN